MQTNINSNPNDDGKKKYWATITAPYLELPLNKSVRICWIPIGSPVDVDESMSDETYYQVFYNGKKGWVNRSYLERYLETLPKDVVTIHDQTPEKNDFEQYFIFNKVKQVNFCGQICVAQILNADLQDVIAHWKENAYQSFLRVMSGGRARGTGYGELQEILKAMGKASLPLTTALYEPVVNRSLYTPQRLLTLVNNGGVIAGVKMDSVTGRLRGQGVGHWVNVIDVFQERSGYGSVRIYNPAPNREEDYSWAEFIASAVSPYGVFVSN